MDRRNIIRWVVIAGIVVAIAFLERERPKVVPGSSDANLQSSAAANRQAVIATKSKEFQRPHEIVSPAGFVNTAPFTLASLIGKKVILLDFWTYSCINCQRTFPYLNDWYKKYHDQGLEIVGIHTPEFEFEKKLDNVQRAVQQYGITYPVVLDNDYGTWSAYRNSYWPHEYVIDIDGFVVHEHIGEGDYDETEKSIQAALAERAAVLGQNVAVMPPVATPSGAIAFDPMAPISPETYFGSARNEFLGNGRKGVRGLQNFMAPAVPKSNTLYLDGQWQLSDESAQAVGNADRIIYTYTAKNVYVVASSKDGVAVTVWQDGKIVKAEAGADVSKDGSGQAVIQGEGLYHIIANPDYGQHTLEIKTSSPGLNAFTFTFG